MGRQFDASFKSPSFDNIRSSAAAASNAGAMVARKRNTSVVTQRVSHTAFPSGDNVKGRQQWKYVGGNILRAPSTKKNRGEDEKQTKEY